VNRSRGYLLISHSEYDCWGGSPVTLIKLLSLLLALSMALNIAFSAFVIADGSGQGAAKSVFTAATAFSGAMALFFAALADYH